MPDQLLTTTGQLEQQLFPPKDLAYWVGKLLQAPVEGTPTQEDYLREHGIIGLPSAAQTARETGQIPLDVLTYLGPLLGALTSRQYARTKTGKPAPTWKEQAPFTHANSPLEQLLGWRKVKPWENKPPEGESAWTYRNPPQIGGPTGKGMTPEAAKAAMEQEQFQAMLKQIRAEEALEAARRPAPPRPTGPPREIDADDLVRRILEQDRQRALIREAFETIKTPPLSPMPGEVP